MKMLVIAVDGHAVFRCGLVKNPDLLRRKIAAETGSGYIVWAAIPILAASAAKSLSHIQNHVLPSFTARVQLQHDPPSSWPWPGCGWDGPFLGILARNLSWRVSKVARWLASLKRNMVFCGRHQEDRP
jgi:hypothetical protein